MLKFAGIMRVVFKNCLVLLFLEHFIQKLNNPKHFTSNNMESEDVETGFIVQAYKEGKQ